MTINRWSDAAAKIRRILHFVAISAIVLLAQAGGAFLLLVWPAFAENQ